MWLKYFFNHIKASLLAESWSDLFVQWLHNFPLPYWLTCLLAGGLIPFTVIIWGISTTPLNNILTTQGNIFTSFSFVSLTLIPPYGLFMLWHLENGRQELVNRFYKDDENPQNPKLAILIWKLSWRILFLFGTAFLVLFVLIVNPPALGITLAFLAQWFLLSIFWFLFIKITKTLSSVYKLKSQFTNINLFDLAPIYQLSQLVQRIALYLISIAIIIELPSIPSIIANRNILGYLNSIDLIEKILLYLGPTLILIACLVFIIPVFWIRKEIVVAKTSLLTEIDKKLQLAFENQEQEAETENFSKVEDLKKYIDALIFRKEYVTNISELPWEKRVFREFSAAIIFPLILWVIQLILTRWINK